MKDTIIMIIGAIYTLFMGMLGTQHYIKENGLEPQAAYLTIAVWIICGISVIRTLIKMKNKDRRDQMLS